MAAKLRKAARLSYPAGEGLADEVEADRTLILRCSLEASEQMTAAVQPTITSEIEFVAVAVAIDGAPFAERITLQDGRFDEAPRLTS